MKIWKKIKGKGRGFLSLIKFGFKLCVFGLTKVLVSPFLTVSLLVIGTILALILIYASVELFVDLNLIVPPNKIPQA